MAGRQVTPSKASQVVEDANAWVNNSQRLAYEKRQIDPALESLAVLATPSIRVGFCRRSIDEQKEVAVRKQLHSPDSDSG